MTPEQPTLFDLEPETARIEWCQACHSCRLAGKRPADVEQRYRDDHAIQSDGRCRHMHRNGTKEPYYTVEEVLTQVFEPGGRIQYPRPEGFGGLYDLRKA